MKLPKPAADLIALSDLFVERAAQYGDNYNVQGLALSAILGPVTLTTDHDYNRFMNLCHITTKLSRYAQNFSKGGHNDSLDDLAVYAMIQKELDAQS